MLTVHLIRGKPEEARGPTISQVDKFDKLEAKLYKLLHTNQINPILHSAFFFLEYPKLTNPNLFY